MVTAWFFRIQKIVIKSFSIRFYQHSRFNGTHCRRVSWNATLYIYILYYLIEFFPPLLLIMSHYDSHDGVPEAARKEAIVKRITIGCDLMQFYFVFGCAYFIRKEWVTRVFFFEYAKWFARDWKENNLKVRPEYAFNCFENHCWFYVCENRTSSIPHG